MNNLKIIIITAALLMAIAVAAGAFGAHSLKNTLSSERLETWQTAVQYQVWHALGVMFMALIGAQFQIPVAWPAGLILAGILIFSGSLYALCLTGIGWFGALTPIGGVAFILGWVFFAIQLLKYQN